MKQNDEKAFLADYLKKIVEQNGNDYLGENAYGIYRQLLEKKSVSPLSARMLLLALLSEVHQKSLELVTADAISQQAAFASQQLCAGSQQLPCFAAKEAAVAIPAPTASRITGRMYFFIVVLQD